MKKQPQRLRRICICVPDALLAWLDAEAARLSAGLGFPISRSAMLVRLLGIARPPVARDGARVANGR
jgi:hypothetical protein